MNYNEVKELISIFVDTDLTEMELRFENLDIRLNRGEARPSYTGQMPAGVSCQPPVQASPDASAPLQEAAFKGGSVVTVMEQATADTQDVQAAIQSSDNAQTGQTAGTTDVAPAGAAEAEGTVITAPLVGTFYSSPAPDQPPFVKVGDIVAEGDVVCIIEAMKFMNEVNSEISGKVAEILVKDGELVEYGQPLIRIV